MLHPSQLLCWTSFLCRIKTLVIPIFRMYFLLLQIVGSKEGWDWGGGSRHPLRSSWLWLFPRGNNCRVSDKKWPQYAPSPSFCITPKPCHPVNIWSDVHPTINPTHLIFVVGLVGFVCPGNSSLFLSYASINGSFFSSPLDFLASCQWVLKSTVLISTYLAWTWTTGWW